MRKKVLIGLAIATALTACANSGALMVGPDTYQVTTRVPLTGAAGAQSDALKTANEYCTSLGRQILLQHTASGECALHGGCGNATITFYCLKPGDPALHRPEEHTDQ